MEWETRWHGSDELTLNCGDWNLDVVFGEAEKGHSETLLQFGRPSNRMERKFREKR